RSQALTLQRVGKSVDLEDKLAERIVPAGPSCTKGKIFLAQRRNHIGKSLQRPHYLRAQRESADEPGEHQEERECPLCLTGVVAQPQHQLANAQGKQTREKRVEDKAPLEAHLFFLFALRRCRYGMPEDVELRGHISGCDGTTRSGSSPALLPRG